MIYQELDQRNYFYIKKICDLENGNISDEALKLIVKISEGSVRDSLSLLDRALLSNDKEKRLELSDAQKIFGYFDKSHLIKIFKYFKRRSKQNIRSL